MAVEASSSQTHSKCLEEDHGIKQLDFLTPLSLYLHQILLLSYSISANDVDI